MQLAAMIRALASLRLTAAALAALALGVAWAYVGDARSAWSVAAPMLVLALNLAAAIAVNPAFRRTVAGVVAAWKRRGAQSWKEVMMALAPPVLLVPAYDLYVAWLQRGQAKRE